MIIKMNTIYLTPLLIALLSILPTINAQADDFEDNATRTRAKRIASGTRARRGQFPYACHISWYWPAPSQRDPDAGYPAGAGNYTALSSEPRGETFDPTHYVCSCAIIHKSFVLTAAHCFQPAIDYYNKTSNYTLEMNATNWPLFVRAGIVDGKLNEPGLQERYGRTVLVHWTYQNQSTLYDVDAAIVNLKYPFDIDDRLHRVRPANIGKTDGPYNHLNIHCIGLGFGDEEYYPPTNDSMLPSGDTAYTAIDRLNYYKVQVGPARYCRYLQRKLDLKSVYFDLFYLCAVSNNATHKQHTCNGDMGGPLVCGGILMGVMAQKREKAPCDLVGNSFTMYTYAGSKEMLDWLNVFIPDLPPVLMIPFEEPWAPEPPWGVYKGDDDFPTNFTQGAQGSHQ